MANSKRDKHDWVNNLRNLHLKNERTPEGDGWKTYAEILAETGLGENRLRKLIREGIREGKIITYEGSTMNKGHERLTRRIWYKYK